MIIILLTIATMLLIQRLTIFLASQYSENDFAEAVYWRAARVCDIMGWSIPEAEREDVEGLDRYNEDDSLPDVYPRVTKIVVPDEYSRIQVMLALRHLHDSDIDTDYMAVNEIVHCYTDSTGEPTGDTPLIVVEDASDRTVGDIDTRFGGLVVKRSNDLYTITVAGEVKHPNLSSDSAVGAMCHYLHGAEYSLMKAEKIDDAMIERAAKALERQRTSGYEWSDELFDIWWNRDPSFVTRETGWDDGFRGTRKGHLLHEVATVLRAARK
jgi:hypothetical protein